MRDLLNYLLITVLIVLGGVFLINEMRILKDSPQPQNYNGYFSLVDEELLLNVGFDGIQYIESEYGTGYSLYIADISIEQPLQIAINFTKPYILLNEDTGAIHYISGFNIQRFYYQEWQIYIQYMLIDGTSYSNTDGYANLRILGVSNYEVQP